MEYYSLKLSPYVKNPIRIKKLDILASKTSFEAYNDLNIYYFDYEEDRTEITSILTSPIFLIDKEIRDLFSLYSNTMKFKGLQLFSTDEIDKKKAVLYFLPDIPKVDCLSKKARINPNGTIDIIIIEKTKLEDYPIFGLDQIAEQKVIINEDVAESLLRRNLYGTGFEKVTVL